MTLSAPEPMDDYEGYILWCELHACGECEGTGEIDGEFDGDEHTCPRCGGSGIDETEGDPANETDD